VEPLARGLPPPRSPLSLPSTEFVEQQNLTFLAHGGKYLFLIELLTLNSNTLVVSLYHPPFFVTVKLNVKKE
jgi:hypothetical protein